MRFSTLWLDGYGRFTGRVLELGAGLQVICGPNEQGKSTIRNFLTDMLYGQRRGPQLRQFDEANELRRPWNGTGRYGGRLAYVLDDGRAFEVQRDFDKKRGTVAIFDRTHMRDVTGEFQRLKGREPSFAESHLGIGKAVFISSATLGPMSLADLGDEDALAQVREKIVSLADTSDESGTAESALHILSERMGEIGRPVSHSKRPLPLAKARLERLDQELARVRAMAAEAGSMDAQWKKILDRLNNARRRKAALEDELTSIEQRDRARRLVEAQRLQARLDEVTQVCFQHNSVREFPLERTADVQRAANAAATARAQAERTSTELSALERQLGEESGSLDAEGVPSLVDIPEEMEQELAELDGRIVRLRERIERMEGELAHARDRLSQAQRDLQTLPDFSRLGADPVAWLSQLAASFRVARQSRETAVEALKRVREELARRQAARASAAEVFAALPDFPRESRELEVASRLNEERIGHLQSEIESLHIEAEERWHAGPVALWMAALFAGVTLACAGAAIGLRMPIVYLPAACSAATAAVFVVRWNWVRKSAQKTGRELQKAREDLARVEGDHEALNARLGSILRKANAGSLREIEAQYERYLRLESELETLTQTEQRQSAETREACERVEHLFARLQETFQSAGETVAHEDDLDQAAGRAMSRYQEYRDAKRRLGESRDKPAQLQQQLAALQTELEGYQRAEIDRALEVRQSLRGAGFREEARYTNVLAALQAYHVRTSQVRDKLGRTSLMRERIQALRARLGAEQHDDAKQGAALAQCLLTGGAESIEAWHELAKAAKAYRDARDERVRLRERLDATLRDDTIESLQAMVDKDGTGPGPLSRNIDDVRSELQQCAATIDSLLGEERDLQIALTRHAAGQRSPNEVEEERGEAAAQAAGLELEFEATSIASSLIEEAARNRHARIAPRIAKAAGGFLGRITHGAYNEVMVSRELAITVRIPETARLSDDPKRLLSKGTIDQVYFALRLALVQAMSANGESVPLLLDDPFANYDDSRLASALELLTEIGASHQVLLFTCRQDVAQAARTLGVPVVGM